MKILLISNFKDSSGWSFAAQAYALAMDAAGIDIVIRNIKLNNIQGEVHPRIVELEKKSDKNCDVVIQKVLPHMMSYDGNFKKNIGLFVTETNHFKNCNWKAHLNIMDSIIVPSKMNREACLNTNITKPVFVIPEPYDEDQFSLGYEPLDLGLPENSFNFYFIGENTKRKNVRALLEAFHVEFRPWEPVNLVLKTNMPGIPEEQQEGAIQEYIKKVKYGLKLYHDLNKYKGEIVLLGRLSNEDIMRLHASCHCCVAPSYGESWNRVSFDALAFGNPVLATKGTGMDDYMPYEFLIKSNEVLATDNTDTFGELLNADEFYHEIDKLELMAKMRNVYENYKEYKNIAINTNLKEYTYESVGRKIKDMLCGK